MDDQEREQIRQIRRLMNSEGWAYLMAAWVQTREAKIISQMKKSKTEMPWRYQQGRLDGFDVAMNLAEFLVGQLREEDREEVIDANKILEELKGV